ncbi:two-component regulator propeller domain-containing protein [Parabacteroides sp. AF18-52]
MQNGLADNTVLCIHKDMDGFMWFGTDNGLSRYDGKNIKNFGSDGLYMKVSSIHETGNNLLWLNVSGQLFCFDRRMEHFVSINENGKFTGVQDELCLFYLSNMLKRCDNILNQHIYINF